MSWSLASKVVSLTANPTLSEEELSFCEIQNPGCTESVLTVWNSALALCASGVLGPDDKTFVITIHGHCNPTPVPLASPELVPVITTLIPKDYLSIIISQM